MTSCSELNNTYIFDNTTQSNLAGCNANETTECYTQLGGLFNEAASSSWSWAGNSSALSTASENLPLINPKHNTDLWATDVFTVTPTKNISQFPLGISRGAGENMNTLGLGRNSTLLNALVNNGDIAARAWGFWQGWNSQYQMDGNIVLGGYDMNKISGPNITLPTSTPDDLNTDCFLATVTDIKMDLKNGSSLSLFGPNRAGTFLIQSFPNLVVILSLGRCVGSLVLLRHISELISAQKSDANDGNHYRRMPLVLVLSPTLIRFRYLKICGTGFSRYPALLS